MKDDPTFKESKQNLNLAVMVVAIIIIVIVYFSVFADFSESQRDCDYQDSGCQGETDRFNQ